MGIEQRFNVPFIAGMALREKQIQQNYRPIIAVHKWFARRPGTLFRGLILAEFGDGALERLFFESNDFSGLRIADPFMGGGTPLIEANRLGCDVIGFDVNPMAAWIVREEIQELDLSRYEQAAAELVSMLRRQIGAYYRTSCPIYGDPDVPVKSFLWVKVLACNSCGFAFDLFPGYLLAEDRRHPRNVVVCHQCGALNEVAQRRDPGRCHACGVVLSIAGPARRGWCLCPHCGTDNSYPGNRSVPLEHRLFAIEYYNPKRKPAHKGRFFKKPDADDLARVDAACEHWRRLDERFVPDEPIPPGDETSRLHRWGYTRYRQLFNPRQLLGLELSCRLIAEIPNERIHAALATNLSDLLRYQNMLCRYDTMALKSLDVFSIHGFPVGLVQCESNLLGITSSNGANVGSGGWLNIIQKYTKAKGYCAAPFEVRAEGKHKVRVPIDGEWIGDRPNSTHQSIAIHCANSAQIVLPTGTLDAVFTDPPYFGNVQYGELMDFCYVWLRRLAPPDTEGFDQPSTRSTGELTGNVTQSRGLENFAEGLASVYCRMAEALKSGAPLVFTYHHNKLDAYCAVGLAILDAGLVCTVALPCPAEMGGSIHIHGTASSIVDTVFVCRDSRFRCVGKTPATVEDLVAVVAHDLAQLKIAGRTATHGDARCVLFGHLTRVAVEQLRPDWNRSATTAKKLSHLRNRMVAFGAVEALVHWATDASFNPKSPAPTMPAQKIVEALS
ncbi:MAG: DUF1156 domain-containing protein [Synechococcus sp. SB0676_bin_10]|uniref:DUF1156 domain-containing protein n=1 Tax=Synechococcus sp. SB0676_bin_10 TaxID=2604869 RepID=A0A6B1F828_9SYNE|nr:DNA methylase [Cyanobacteria bacterium MAG IRC3_bin_20]MDE0647587.1 DNA methylase [Cyanobacteria bacterium MAG IRC4_bin_6]MYG37915.1 DUF1156 domain-containing protein [Synechococcus sp. SB0676_bin_10]MYK07052.1 DUF1156 domain-containing protein [Synechococcus sp. SB0670_bin_20]